MTTPHWVDDAKCAGHTTDEHGHDPYDLSSRRDILDKDAHAAKLCHGCRVKANCARLALANDTTGVVMAGVWITDRTPFHTQRTTRRRLATIARTTPQAVAA